MRMYAIVGNISDWQLIPNHDVYDRYILRGDHLLQSKLSDLTKNKKSP